MKLNKFLREHPWAETYDALSQEPPAQIAFPRNTAQRLIERQRESQLPTLRRLMLSPVLEREDVLEGDTPEPYVFKLTSPRRTARLFLDEAARVGKDLRPLEPMGFRAFDEDTARLGQLLRLLAIAQEASGSERKRLGHDWAYVYQSDADVGPVLTPMVQPTDVQPTDTDSYERYAQDLTTRVAQLLRSDDTDARIRRGSPKTLERWTLSLVRAGSARLRWLGAPL